jgi:hypothetical protein
MSMTLRDRWEKGKRAAEALERAEHGDRMAEKIGEDWGKTATYVRQHRSLFERFDSYEVMISEITKEFGDVEDVSWRMVLQELVMDGHEYSEDETFLYVGEFSSSYKFGISVDVNRRLNNMSDNEDRLGRLVRIVNKYSFPNRRDATHAENRCKSALIAMGYVADPDVSKEICYKDVDVIGVVDRCVKASRSGGGLERMEKSEGLISFESTAE